MLTRAFVAWLGLMVLAILNGLLRQTVLIPRMGEPAGHIVSTLLLSAVILVAAWAWLPWLGARHAPQAWRIGGLWLVLTVAFEFLAGHFLFGNSWERLLADYNVAHGRVWLLVLVATLLGPVLAHARRSPDT